MREGSVETRTRSSIDWQIPKRVSSRRRLAAPASGRRRLTQDVDDFCYSNRRCEKLPSGLLNPGEWPNAPGTHHLDTRVLRAGVGTLLEKETGETWPVYRGESWMDTGFTLFRARKQIFQRTRRSRIISNFDITHERFGCFRSRNRFDFRRLKN